MNKISVAVALAGVVGSLCWARHRGVWGARFLPFRFTGSDISLPESLYSDLGVGCLICFAVGVDSAPGVMAGTTDEC